MKNHNKLWAEVTKQHNTGYKIGGLKDLLARVLFYVSGMNFVLLAATAYHTTLREPIHEYVPWFTFPLFLGTMIALVLIAMALEYKLVLPSSMAYANLQMYKHQSLLKKQLDRIEKTLAKMQGNGEDGVGQEGKENEAEQ